MGGTLRGLNTEQLGVGKCRSLQRRDRNLKSCGILHWALFIWRTEGQVGGNFDTELLYNVYDEFVDQEPLTLQNVEFRFGPYLGQLIQANQQDVSGLTEYQY